MIREKYDSLNVFAEAIVEGIVVFSRSWAKDSEKFKFYFILIVKLEEPEDLKSNFTRQMTTIINRRRRNFQLLKDHKYKYWNSVEAKLKLLHFSSFDWSMHISK